MAHGNELSKLKSKAAVALLANGHVIINTQGNADDHTGDQHHQKQCFYIF